MQDMNILLVSVAAFLAVIILLLLLAGLMRGLTSLWPEPALDDAVALADDSLESNSSESAEAIDDAAAAMQEGTVESASSNTLSSERERAAIALALFLEMQKASNRPMPALPGFSSRSAWKIIGRLEGV